jgi:hypothetical protein
MFATNPLFPPIPKCACLYGYQVNTRAYKKVTKIYFI